MPFLTRPRLLLAASALLPRLVLALYLGVWGDPDRWEYDVIADNIRAGAGHVYDRDGFVYAAYAPPLWSYVLAALLWLPGATRGTIQVAQAFFCVGAAVCCASLARRLGGGRTVVALTGLLVALQPSLVYYSVAKSDPLPLNTFLLSLIALCGATLVETPGVSRAAVFGLLTALGTLSRGTPAIAVPLVAVLLALRWRRKAAIPVLAMGTAMTLGLTPWLIRNAVVVGSPMLTSTSGENLWRGNNESAGGGVLDPTGRSLSNLDPANPVFPAAVKAVLASGTEAERQSVFMTEALRFIGDHPVDAASLFGTKMRSFWWKVVSNPGDYDPAAARLYEWIYRSELALALVGVASFFRQRPAPAAGSGRSTPAFLVALMIGISIMQSAFYVQGRHRFLIEPLLLIFTAWGATVAGAALRSRVDRAVAR